jgi:hypothetical protein
LHRTLFEEPPFEASWLAIGREDLPALEAVLRRSLGDDLGGYLLAASPPSTPRDLVLAAIAVAVSVDDLRSTHISGKEAERFRIRLDASLFEGALPGEVGALSSEISPTMDVWLGATGEVLRVTVGAGQHDAGGSADIGWSVNYRYERRFAPLANDGRATSVAAIDPAQLRPARLPCQLRG